MPHCCHPRATSEPRVELVTRNSNACSATCDSAKFRRVMEELLPYYATTLRCCTVAVAQQPNEDASILPSSLLDVAQIKRGITAHLCTRYQHGEHYEHAISVTLAGAERRTQALLRQLTICQAAAEHPRKMPRPTSGERQRRTEHHSAPSPSAAPRATCPKPL